MVNLTSHKSKAKTKFLLRIFYFLLILVFSLHFGQVIGNLYINNIQQEVREEEPSGTKKVLRLKKLAYYSVLIASFQEKEQAILLGQELSLKEIPVVITGQVPYQVLVGFLNNQDNFITLLQSLKVEGQEAEIVKAEINQIAFKFDPDDQYSQETVAPFLGKLSLCLEKALFLYTDINTNNPEVLQIRNKFSLLAQDLEEMADEGWVIAEKDQNSKLSQEIAFLSQRLEKWAQSIKNLENNWQNTSMLISQQQALALVDEYMRFLENNQ